LLAEIVAPVFLLIAVGVAAARGGLLDERAVKALSDAALLVFLPALLFGTIARVEFGELSPGAALAYYCAGLPLFAVVLAVQARRRGEVSTAVVHALGAVFSNTVMLGIPVVKLAFGEAGLALLLTIIAVHALVYLTIGALVIELAVILRGAGAGEGTRWRRLARDLGPVIRSALLHPVVLPILLGVVWSAAGVALPRPVDATLSMLGAAAAPLCLVLLGASLAQSGFGQGLATAAGLTVVKNLVHPALVWVVGGFVLGAAPLPLAIATVTAAMPIGANVYLFAQRYDSQVAEVSAGVTLSTLVSAATVPMLLALLA
jgi:predicted permease